MIFLSIAGRGFGSAEWEIRARSKVFNFARDTILATMNVCPVYEILLWNSSSLKPMPCHASLKWRVNASVFNIILVVWIRNRVPNTLFKPSNSFLYPFTFWSSLAVYGSWNLDVVSHIVIRVVRQGNIIYIIFQWAIPLQKCWWVLWQTGSNLWARRELALPGCKIWRWSALTWEWGALKCSSLIDMCSFAFADFRWKR